MFQFLGALHASYVFRCGSSGLVLMGFPHSEISGSTFATNSRIFSQVTASFIGPQAPRHSPCALCSLTYKSSIQPALEQGEPMLMNSPINTIGTISLLAKLAICLPLHLLRCTTCSFERAHGHHMNMRGLERTNGNCFGSASSSSRRNTGAEL